MIEVSEFLSARVLASISTRSRSLPLKFKPLTLCTPDGVKICAQEWGNGNGPEILFIHGISQCHLSWLRQVRSNLAKSFRMITYDIRGHGGSDKPLDPVYYRENKRWANEVNTIIIGAGLKKPVLVGWSYGGRIVMDYLTYYGDSGLSGINFVDTVTKTSPTCYGRGSKHLLGFTSENLVENIQNTIAFLRCCTAEPLRPAEAELMIAYNMVVPPKIRQNMLGRPTPYEETLKRITVPVLITHGAKDQVVKPWMARYTASAVPKSQTSIYKGIGHSPFWENASRFNRELAAFVMGCTGTHLIPEEKKGSKR